jgi:hypothetical protein
MTFRNTLLTAGLLALAVSAASAIPTIKLVRSGAAMGAVAEVQIMAVPDGGQGMNAAVVALKFDTAKAAIAATGATTAGSGWAPPAYSVAGDTVTLAAERVNGDDVTAESVIFSIKLTNNSATGSTIETAAGGTIASAAFDQWDIPAGLKAAIVNGKVRNLEPIPGSPAVGPGGLIAVGAGNKLYLLNADLTDATGWTGGKEIGGQVTGRPAFGTQNGTPVIAVGTQSGTAAVFALDGTQISNAPVPDVTGIVTAPAVLDKTIVWAVQTASGTALIGATLVPTGAGTVTGSPAVFGGAVVAGKDTGIMYARIDDAGAITPQADATVGEAIGSPAVDRAGNTAVAAGASGKVYKINLANGTLVGDPLDIASGAPLSAPFVNYAAGAALFGGADGKVHSVLLASMATNAETFGLDKVVSPIVVNGKTVAADVTGKVGASVGEMQDVAGQPGPAIAATGPTAADSIIVTTTDGSVIALPAF